MKLWWRLTRTLLLTAIIPAGLIALGFYILGPRMALMPRLSEKGWEDELVHTSAQPDPQPSSPVENPQLESLPVLTIEAQKTDRRRKRRRQEPWQIISPGHQVPVRSVFDSTN